MKKKRNYRSALALPGGYLEADDIGARIIEMKVSAARIIASARRRRYMSQTVLGIHMNTTQQRISRMENADPEVSLDFYVRALLVLDFPAEEALKAFNMKGSAGWIRRRRAFLLSK